DEPIDRAAHLPPRGDRAQSATLAQEIFEALRPAFEHLGHAVEDLALQIRAPGRPPGLRRARLTDSLAKVLPRAARDVREEVAFRVGDRIVPARLRPDEFPADVELVGLFDLELDHQL